MALYKINNGVASQWNGEPINGVFHPSIIEQLWSEQELNNIGLYKVQPADPVSPGEIIISSSLSVVNGKPKIVNVTKTEGPIDYPLTARQLRLGMIRNNISLSNVTNILNGIANTSMRNEYSVYWEYSSEVHWDHPITQALIAAVGISQNAAAVMWMTAKDY